MDSFCFTGKSIHFGNDVDTDAILPARYLSLSTQEELGPHFMEDLSPGLAAQVAPGSILVAGENFGCGSSREHAPVAVRGSGFACVVAASFSRLFYRNAINIGLPVLVVKDALQIPEDSLLTVDCVKGIVRDMETGKEYIGTPLTGFMLEILSSGGLIAHLEKRLESVGK